MIFDHRTYTCRPGTLAKHMALYQEHGLAAQKRHLGEPVFYATTETGDVNSYIHVWAYENAGDREAKRAAMEADPDWQNYKKLSAEAGYLIRQENRLMIPTGFFSLGDR
ncbi:MAG: NIPSNAP family protein [Geminicoccaceae bacterium]|nr:NIPSNAP family protein [Geminicoccaceae bacterium]